MSRGSLSRVFFGVPSMKVLIAGLGLGALGVPFYWYWSQGADRT